MSAFLTENPDTLALSFELVHRALVVLTSEEGEEIEATLLTKGECSYNLRRNTASDVRKDSVVLLSPEGDLIEGKGVSYIYTGGLAEPGGRRGRPYTLREPVDE
jgi:hypothetical protein